MFTQNVNANKQSVYQICAFTIKIKRASQDSVLCVFFNSLLTAGLMDKLRAVLEVWNENSLIRLDCVIHA